MVNIKTGKMIKCDNYGLCNNIIYKRPSELKGKYVFCSLKFNYWYKTGKQRVPYKKCLICGEDIINRWTKLKYCSRKCYFKDRDFSHTEKSRLKLSKSKTGTQKGKLNNNWKGGLTEGRNRDYSSIGYRLWKDKIFQRDNYTCRNLDCLKKSDGNKIKINAHHVLSYSEYPEFRKKVWNGITLCEKCHKLIHKKNRKEIRISGGTVKITEVFKIEIKGKKIYHLGTLIDNVFIETSGYNRIWRFKDIWQKDGFSSAEQMFKTLDKMYDLNESKQFYIYRWKWKNDKKTN